MAHVAEIRPTPDADGLHDVLRVLVVANGDVTDPATGTETDAQANKFMRSIFGEGTSWVRTSYNGSFYGRYAAVGGKWNPALSIFLIPRPYPSAAWGLNTTKDGWIATNPQPSNFHQWTEEFGGRWMDSRLRIDNVTMTLRFTETERANIQASTDPQVKEADKALRNTPVVRLDSPDLDGYLNLLVNKALITSARKTELLAAP